MENNDKQIALNTLNAWTDLAYEKEDDFMAHFTKEKLSSLGLCGVWWNDEGMKIYYILDSGQHITNDFSIAEWLTWYEENK